MDYLDRHAEESEGSTSDTSLEDLEPKTKKRKAEKKKGKEGKSKKKRIESSDEDEDDEDDEEDAQAKEEMKDFIADEEEEEENEDDDNDDKSDKLEEDELDEDDLDLLEENLGPNRAKNRKRIIQPDDSDEEDDRHRIEKNLFEAGDDDETGTERRGSARGDYNDDAGRYSGSEASEDDGFIVHEGDRPRHRTHHRRDMNVDGAALDEARDVFGVDDFNFDEFYEEGEGDEEMLEDEEDEEGEEGEPKVRGIRKKEKKSTLLDTLDPAELERGYLSAKDKKIVLEDKPERYLLRRTPVTEAENSELENEAQWIMSFAFGPFGSPVSRQEANELMCVQEVRKQVSEGALDRVEGEREVDLVKEKAQSVVKEILNLIRNQNFEIPFIAFYRKESIENMLNINELWKIYIWDEKWCHLQNRKNKLLELMKRMLKYQTDSELVVSRPLPESDMMDVEGVQTMEQLIDCSSQFNLFYGTIINKMVEWEKSKKALEGGADADVFATKYKAGSRNDKYNMCIENGLRDISTLFGLTARQFAENLDYRKHDVVQHPKSARDLAAEYCNFAFETADQVLDGAAYMLAKEISRQPKVRDRIRQDYRNSVRIRCKPTRSGREKIDETHPVYARRYLNNKPIYELKNDEYLYLEQARKAGLLEVTLYLPEPLSKPLIQEQLFKVDEYSEVAEEWNRLREDIVRKAIDEIMVPSLRLELHDKLLDEAGQYVADRCGLSIYQRIEPGPYKPFRNDNEEEDDYQDDENTIRVLAIVYALDKFEVSFGALLNQDGVVMDYVRLPHFNKRANLRFPNMSNPETRLKIEDNERLSKFLIRRRPHMIVLPAEDMEARKHKMDIEFIVDGMLAKRDLYSKPDIVIMENDVSKVYMNSNMAQLEFPDYPPYLRQAVSLGRSVIDPVIEYSHLYNPDEDIFCLPLHPLQNEIPKDRLEMSLMMEFVTRINEVGVDINRCVEHPHTANMLQFVCGLGPRKSAFMIKQLKIVGTLLEARARLVMLCRMGPKVFMNSAGFIKINTERVADKTDQYVEILDGSRVHPETYEWARKMAVDALEFDDSGDPTTALEEVLTTPDKLKDLDLDAFAEELARQGFGNKADTLYDIRKELSGRYVDLRPAFQPPNEAKLFKLLTKESKETLYEGKLVLGKVFQVVHKKLTPEQMDNKNAQPRNESELFTCQYCQTATFNEIQEVFAHIDDNMCPGQPVGIRVKLENGMTGFVHNKMLSDNPDTFKHPLERVKIGQPIYCRVKAIIPDKFELELSCRSSDLRDTDASRPVDPYFDHETKEFEDQLDRDSKEKQKQVSSSFVKRVISHPHFKNVTFREAERMLRNAEQGEAIIRPSSKSAMHLTVTWKVTDGVFHHVDVQEANKDKDFQLGKQLFIGLDEFEDLDEILARHIQPMAMFAREIMQHKCYIPEIIFDDRSLVEARLQEEKRANPSRIPYFFSPSGDYPSKFLISYQARIKPRHEYITATPDGIRFRQQLFPSLENLLQWFKQHYRDPPPLTQANQQMRRM